MFRQYLRKISVFRLEPRGPRALLRAGNLTLLCRIGRAGATANKREGDGKSPTATLSILQGFWRSDRRLPPRTGIRLRPIRPFDGWCDASGHRSYNRPVTMPFRASHEEMARADGQYDVVLDLDWNRSCRRQGRGSAIFLHLTSTEGLAAIRRGATGGGTAGCIAVPPNRIDALLMRIGPATRIRIR